MSRIFITRTDSGSEQFNFSEIFGSALSASISTYSYHPHADKTLGQYRERVGHTSRVRHDYDRGERILARYSKDDQPQAPTRPTHLKSAEP